MEHALRPCRGSLVKDDAAVGDALADRVGF